MISGVQGFGGNEGFPGAKGSKGEPGPYGPRGLKGRLKFKKIDLILENWFQTKFGLNLKFKVELSRITYFVLI